MDDNAARRPRYLFPLAAKDAAKAWSEIAVLQSGPRSRRRRRGHRMSAGGFRSVELNTIGWSALVGVGTLVGLVTKAVARLGWAGALALGLTTAWSAAIA